MGFTTCFSTVQARSEHIKENGSIKVTKTVTDYGPQVVTIALLVASAVAGSFLFQTVGALFGPILALVFVATVSEGECLEPITRMVQKIKPGFYQGSPIRNPEQILPEEE